MRVIIGYGNDFRGEDAFGIHVIEELEKLDLPNTKLLKKFQLTPELTLELLDATKIVFVDASFCKTNHYTLAVPMDKNMNNQNISHQLSPHTIIEMLKLLYDVRVDYEIYSMMTCEFERIVDERKYWKCVKTLIKNLK